MRLSSTGATKETSHRITASDKQRAKGRRAAPGGTIISPADAAPMLTQEKPFFKMRSGGAYAVRVGTGNKPVGFIRVDKDRTPVKIRKRAKRTARKLAEATA